VISRLRRGRSSQTSAVRSQPRGARPEQVAKITIYVVAHRPEYLPIIEQGRVALFGDHKPADTLVGVETLSQPGYLIEVDAIAVIDE
jgi:enamine deaminase RidA (YjgF/YER057c/UK114 family)